MKAQLTTDTFQVDDFELVTGIRVKSGQGFTIAVTDAPVDADFSSTTDSALDIMVAPKELPTELSAVIMAGTQGVSKLFLIGANDAPIKRWVITVYADEAKEFKVGPGLVESRSQE